MFLSRGRKSQCFSPALSSRQSLCYFCLAMGLLFLSALSAATVTVAQGRRMMAELVPSGS